MFPRRYFCDPFFAPRYFAKIATSRVGTFYGYMASLVRQREDEEWSRARANAYRIRALSELQQIEIARRQQMITNNAFCAVWAEL